MSITYAEVVKRAKTEILCRTDYGNRRIRYGRCEVWEKGDQINLWAYWQGYQIKNIEEGVDILLVGQDWGNPERQKEDCERIRMVQEGKLDTCYDGSYDPTNQMLVKLFSVLGYDIRKPDNENRLFFTNFSLGYRTGSEQGGMTKTLMMKDSSLFKDLVLAINPKIIICLGKLTFECVVQKKVTKWLKTLKEEATPFFEFYPDNPRIRVYGVAHCGAWGIRNVGGEENMIKTWMKMRSLEIKTGTYRLYTAVGQICDKI